MGNIVEIELFRQKISHSIKNSGLDLGVTRPLIKEIYLGIQEEYQKILIKEALKEKKKGERQNGKAKA